MTTVFAFLTLMVALMHLSAYLFRNHADPVAELPPVSTPSSGTASAPPQIAIVLAAIEAHRRSGKGQ